MAAGIDEFIGQMGQTLRPNRFAVVIGDSMDFLAHTVSLPDTTIQVNSANSYRTGMTVKTPYALDWGDLTMTFYTRLPSKDKHTELDYFQTWLEDPNGDTSSIFNSGNNYLANFVSEFARDVDVQILNQRDQKVVSFLFEKAFPTSMSYIDLDSGSSDSLLEMTVTFSFEMIKVRTYEYNPVNIKQPSPYSRGILNILGVDLPSLSEIENVHSWDDARALFNKSKNTFNKVSDYKPYAKQTGRNELPPEVSSALNKLF